MAATAPGSNYQVVYVPGTGFVYVIDSLAASDDVNIKFDHGAGDLSVSTSESLEITEAITLDGLLVNILIDLYDQINVLENVSGGLNLGAISINETMGIAESLVSGVPLGLSRFENITLAEFLALLESIAPSAFFFQPESDTTICFPSLSSPSFTRKKPLNANS